MNNNCEFIDLDEKQLKYELFRALRRHESERAIAILKQEKANPNWRHSYGGYSVLLHSFFERDHLVFKYLLTRSDLDVSIKDDHGYDIFYWTSYSISDPVINYRSLLAEAKGSVAQKLQLIVDDKIRAITAESEEKWRQDPLNEAVSLNLGCRYKLSLTHGPLSAGDIVTYSGTHNEPAERGHDVYDDFTFSNGQVKSIYRSSMTVKDSLKIFLDVDEDFECYPEHIRSLVKSLENRAKSTRIQAAKIVLSPLLDYQYIVPILLKHALRERSQNEFLNALCRVKTEAIALVEAYQNTPPSRHTWGYEWILSKMGSSKYLTDYHAMLNSEDSMLIRNAVSHIVNIGDPTSIQYLEAIKDHTQFNVRTDVAKALQLIRGA